MKFLHTKKFRHGSISLALTVVVIAAVILLNTLVTALSEKYLWYIDMTPGPDYDLTDSARALMDLRFTEDFDREVEIIFCSPEDELWANTAQRYPLYTAKQLEESYKQISVRYVDIYTNPSAVAQYKEITSQDITASSVIVASGTQARVYALSALYQYDSTGTAAVGYNGEQRLISAVLAVTQVEQPVACYTTGHGETDSLERNNAILTLLYESGFEVKAIDLTREELPDECNLLLIFDPTSDFRDDDTISGVSEIDKIKAFLAADNSLMFFFDYDTPELPNLESFMEQWGIVIARGETAGNDAGWLIQDRKSSFDAAGFTNVGVYVEEEGHMGASISAGLRRSNKPKSVVFPMAGAILRPDQYKASTDGKYQYHYYSNDVTRDSYDVFLSTDHASALAGTDRVDAATAPFSYMTLTVETRQDGEGNVSRSQVLACSTTQFATTAAMDTGYGNHSLMAYAASVLGRTEVAVSLDCKYFADLEINDITKAQANQYTVVLTVLPASLIFIAGVYVMVRRKYR